MRPRTLGTSFRRTSLPDFRLPPSLPMLFSVLARESEVAAVEHCHSMVNTRISMSNCPPTHSYQARFCQRRMPIDRGSYLRQRLAIGLSTGYFRSHRSDRTLSRRALIYRGCELCHHPTPAGPEHRLGRDRSALRAQVIADQVTDGMLNCKLIRRG